MPLFLNTATAVISVTTTTTQVLHCHIDAVDLPNGGSTISPVTGQNSIINSAATTNIAASPSASTSRAVKTAWIKNTDAAAVTITVKHFDGSVTVTEETLTLPAGYTYRYEEKRGWYVTDANGVEVVDNTQTAGLLVAIQVINAGTTSFQVSSRTNKIRARLLGSGASAGGNAATAGTSGGGGGAGAYVEWYVAVVPGTTYNCVVGAAVTGTSNAAGTNGNATTLTVGATTCIAPGGNAGANGTSATVSANGGAPTAVGTNGTINGSGAPGEDGQAATTGHGGNGGSSPFGGGGLGATTTAAGGNATGFGAGGGGSHGTAATAEAGGASTAGLLIVEEYTG